MRGAHMWSYGPIPTAITAVAYSFDGSKVYIGAGDKIVMVNASTGQYDRAIVTPHGQITSIAFSRDGTRFATGGTDNYVIVWTSKGKPLFKYPHGSSIQKLAFAPDSGNLLSVAVDDFGYYQSTSDSQTVSKTRLPSKGTTCAFSNYSDLFAVACADGEILVRDGDGDKVRTYKGEGPAAALVFMMPPGSASGVGSPTSTPYTSQPLSRSMSHSMSQAGLAKGSDTTSELLIAANVGMSMALYEPHLGDGALSIERDTLVSIPLQMQVYDRYLLVTGVDGRVHLYTHRGHHLITVCNVTGHQAAMEASLAEQGAEGVEAAKSMKERENYLYGLDVCPTRPEFVISSSSGAVVCFSGEFKVVHALYETYYAQRTSLTAVRVRNMATGHRLTIDTELTEYISKVAVYKGLVAVLSGRKVKVFSLTERGSRNSPPALADPLGATALKGKRPPPIDTTDHALVHRLVAELDAASLGSDCNLICLTAEHLVVCSGSQVRCIPTVISKTA
ncbi:hypothetical protein KIPB_007155, partial [Kipferlia bialata]|eukprot:g7155.t1